jgi:hypothetical protein
MYYQIIGSDVRLAGSLHLIPAGTTVPPWVFEAYGWSEEVYFEADKDDLSKHAFYPAGRSSEARVPAELWATIKARWPAHVAALGPQKLWFISMVWAATGSVDTTLSLSSPISRNRSDSDIPMSSVCA